MTHDSDRGGLMSQYAGQCMTNMVGWGFALLLGMATLGLAPARADHAVSLQLRWEPQFQFAGYIVAKEKGFYADRNLDVELRFAVQPGPRFLSAIDEVTEGRATFGIGAVDVAYARASGKALSIVSSVFQHSAIEIYTKESVQITKPSDLMKLRFSNGLQRNGPADIELRALLRREGVDLSSLQVPDSDKPSFEAFVDGDVDVHHGFSLATPWVARSRGIALNAVSPRAFGIHFYGDSLFAREDFVRENPDVVGRFVEASLAGWRYALQNPDEVIALIAEKYPRTLPIDDPVGFNRFQAEVVASLIDFPIVDLGNTSPDRWQAMVDRLTDLGLINDPSMMDGLVLYPLALELEAARGFDRAILMVVGVTIVVAAVGIGFAIALRWQVALQTEALLDANRRTEEALAAAVAADKAKSEFLATMSHELRSPLTAVIGFAELLGRRTSKELSRDQVSQYAGNIELSGKSLLHLINDILDFAKIGSNSFELTNEPFSLHDELANIPSQFEVKAKENQVTLTTRFDDLDRAAKGDAMRIRQVVGNLIDNAIKFSRGGEVCVSARTETVSDGRLRLIVEVADTGIGIEPDRLERIFLPFRQADNSISRSFGGTGLGLSISKAITNQMGGDVTARSTPDTGTTFTATFELEDISDIYAKLREQGSRNPGNKQLGLRVLIVDDLESNLEVAEALLRGLGCEVLRARNGREAVEQFAGVDLDVILMDLHMPELDGISAARRIRDTAGPAARAKIYAWTADVMSEPSLRESGVDWAGTLLKPTTMASLSETLQRAA